MDNSLYVSLIGLLSCLYAYTGYGCSSQLAEETKNASIAVPRAISWTCLSTGVLGFLYIVGLLYACQDQVDSLVYGTS